MRRAHFNYKDAALSTWCQADALNFNSTNMVSLIVAVADNNGIGYKNRLPWANIPLDMKWFKKHTTHKVVVMGSSTWLSLPGAYRPLPNRTNVVLTSNKSIGGEGVDTLNGSPKEILETLATRYPEKEIVIIGGAKVYGEFINFVDCVYLTRVHQVPDCDAFLPIDDLLAINPHLQLTESEAVTYNNEKQLTFQIWKKQ